MKQMFILFKMERRICRELPLPYKQRHWQTYIWDRDHCHSWFGGWWQTEGYEEVESTTSGGQTLPLDYFQSNYFLDVIHLRKKCLHIKMLYYVHFTPFFDYKIPLVNKTTKSKGDFGLKKQFWMFVLKVRYTK